MDNSHRQYPRIRIHSIQDIGSSIIIKATSIQSRGIRDFIYIAKRTY